MWSSTVVSAIFMDDRSVFKDMTEGKIAGRIVLKV
jgi:hypothetical protein